MSDHAARGNRNERERELSGFAQCTDNVLLVMPRMRRIQKCRNRHRLNGRRIGGDLASDLDVHQGTSIKKQGPKNGPLNHHRLRRDQSSIKKLRSCSLRLG